MKKIVLLSLVIGLVLGNAYSVGAQEPATTISVGAFYGGSEPWGEAGAQYDHNYYLGGMRVRYLDMVTLPKGRLDIGLEVALIPWKMKTEGMEDYKSTIIEAPILNIRYRYPIPPKELFYPFALVGVGLYALSYDVPAEATEPESQAQFGIHFGAGIGYNVSEKVTVDLSVAHHIAFTDHVGQVDVEPIEGNTPYTVVSGGVSYNFSIKK